MPSGGLKAADMSGAWRRDGETELGKKKKKRSGSGVNDGEARIPCSLFSDLCLLYYFDRVCVLTL